MVFDVIVIGNGALGLSIAHRLKARAPEMRLAVLGPATRAGGATSAAGAMLNAWGELVRNQFAWPILAERASLMIESLPLWDGATADLQPFSTAPFAPGWGTLVLDTGRGGESEKHTLATVLEALAARGLDAPIHARGRIIPDGWIDPLVLLGAYEAILRASGADLMTQSAVSLAFADGGWAIALDDGRSVRAARVVLANGAFAQALIDPLEEVRRATPRLVYEAGAGFEVSFAEAPPLPFVMRTLGRGAVGGFHIVPLSRGRFYVGATAEAALTPNWTLPAARLATVKAAFVAEGEPAFASAQFTPRAIGFRALSADGFPLLGQSHAPGLWFATGMRRDGLTSSPMIARLIADAVLDGAVAPVLKRFTPSRALLSYKNGAEALADACAGHGAAEQERLLAIYRTRGLGEFGVNPGILPLYAEDAAFAALDHPRASGAG
jgi:glycine oxidase